MTSAAGKKMQSIRRTDKVRNKVVLENTRRTRKLLKRFKKKKVNLLGHMLTLKCLIGDVTEGEGKIIDY